MTTRPKSTEPVTGTRNTRTNADRPRSRTSPVIPQSDELHPTVSTREDMQHSTETTHDLCELSDLRRLLHVVSELQQIDLNTALKDYKDTRDDDRVHMEEKILETNTNKKAEYEALMQVVEDLQMEKKELESRYLEKQRMYEELEMANKEQEADLKSKEGELMKVKKEKDVALAEKHEALTRLSKELGAKLSDNKPAIAHLNDPNRPLKLGEKYNELYDNQWTDAIEILCNDGSDEERNVKMLLKVFKKCYELCVDLSESQMASLETVLLNPGGSTKPTSVNSPKQAWKDVSSPTIAKSTYKQLKDFRKEVSPLAVGNIFKEHASSKIGWIAKEIPEFVKTSIEVCWLMCAQDPPVVIGSEAVVSDTFDSNVYKAYTHSGTVVSYNVWLPLLLHKDGPLLVKGIVQPIKVHRTRKRTEEAKPKKPDVAERLRGYRPGETYRSPYGQTSTQHVTTTKPAMQYEKQKFDRNGTSPPSEKTYHGGHNRKNYEEYRSHNAAEDRASPVHVAIQSNYRSRQDTYGTRTQTNYQRDYVHQPFKFEQDGKPYVYYNERPYPLSEFLLLYGTTSGVSEL